MRLKKAKKFFRAGVIRLTAAKSNHKNSESGIKNAKQFPKEGKMQEHMPHIAFKEAPDRQVEEWKTPA